MSKQVWNDMWLELMVRGLTRYHKVEPDLLKNIEILVKQLRNSYELKIDEQQARISALEREAEALAQGYREVLAELEAVSGDK